MTPLSPREQRTLRAIDRRLSRDPVLAAVTNLFPLSHRGPRRSRFRPTRSRQPALVLWCGLLIMVAGTACAVTAALLGIAVLAAAGVTVVTLVATTFVVLADRGHGRPLTGRHQLTHH